MDLIALVVGVSLAVGVGVIAHGALSLCIEMERRFHRSAKPGRLHALGFADSPNHATQRTQENRFGMARIPWTSLYAGAALIGLILLAVLGPYLPGIRLGFLAAPAFVWLFRRYLIRQARRFQAGQTRQFLLDLRLHMSLQGSLLLGLESMAKSCPASNPLHACLKHRLAGSAARSGIDLLRQVTNDVRFPLFDRAVQAIVSAQLCGGVADVDQAIGRIIDELNEAVAYQSEEQMQRLPLRITLLAMPFLLGPIVVLLFYPLVDRILKTLAGVSVGGGF